MVFQLIMIMLHFSLLLFHSIAVDEEKRLFEKIIFYIEKENVISISLMICSCNLRDYFEQMVWRLIFNYLERGGFSLTI